MRSVVQRLSFVLIGVLASGSAIGLEVDGVITIEFGATDRVVYTPGALPPQVDPITDLRDRTGRPKDAGKLDNDGNVMTDIFVGDNLHLNDLGNAIWGSTIKAALMPMEARLE